MASIAGNTGASNNQARIRNVKSIPFQHKPIPSSEEYSQEESLFAASYSCAFASERADLLPPNPTSLWQYVSEEMKLSRLEKHIDRLWFAGLPLPPRPLHFQRLLGREIIITEELDFHLVWSGNRMFIKPLCRFLLEPDVWKNTLTCPQSSYGSTNEEHCDLLKTRRIAMGFLFSYASLIRHESDFHIAIDKKLLPRECRWVDWRKLVREVLTEKIYNEVDSRFIYGELRLSRLNTLHFLQTRKLYRRVWNSYADFFSDNFQWLALATVFIAVMLNAFQVGDLTSLARNSDFKRACYVFALVSLFFPLVSIPLLFAGVAIAYRMSWRRTIRQRDARLKDIQLQAE